MNERSMLNSFSVAPGFNVWIIQSIRDESNRDVVLLNMVGPRGSIRATHAALSMKQQNKYMLGGTIKIQSLPGHVILKTELPGGMANWTIISYQAIPARVVKDQNAYVWRQLGDPLEDNTAPSGFFEIFQASMGVPCLPEWSDELWAQGMDNNLISRVRRRNQLGVHAYEIKPRDEKWAQVIKSLFLKGDINLVEGHTVTRKPPTKDELEDAIHYRRFQLGNIVMTPGIEILIEEHNLDITTYLSRHASGHDWGELDLHDQRANTSALYDGTRLFSSYNLEPLMQEKSSIEKIWIITEADRSVTTFLLPDEY